MIHKRTPCLGICSTTYGDLVCRGCKRFSHEVVQWNGFAEDQRELVWDRLRELRAGAVVSIVKIVDNLKLRDVAKSSNIPDVHRLSSAELVYEVLRSSHGQGLNLGAMGLRTIEEKTITGSDPVSVLMRIEGEFYQRSLAHYERNFKIPAD